jgi:hypothetical protein
MKSTKLHGYTGANTDKGGQGAFVECEGTFILEDGTGAGEGVGVGCRCLEADFDDV